VKVGASFLIRTKARVPPCCLLPSGQCDADTAITALYSGFDSSRPRSTIGMISRHVLDQHESVSAVSHQHRVSQVCKSASLAKRGLDPTHAKRCQVSSSCPSEPLHATCACLDNALHVFSRGPSYGGTCTRPSSYKYLVHVLAASSSRSASPICNHCPSTPSTRPLSSPPHRDPAK
jgi:hypothetical protein